MTHSQDYIHDCFLVFDKVGDQKIDAGQIGDLARALGLNPTNKDIRRVTPKTERVSFDEFVPVYQALEKVSTLMFEKTYPQKLPNCFLS